MSRKKEKKNLFAESPGKKSIFAQTIFFSLFLFFYIYDFKIQRIFLAFSLFYFNSFPFFKIILIQLQKNIVVACWGCSSIKVKLGRYRSHVREQIFSINETLQNPIFDGERAHLGNVVSCTGESCTI